jgi:hypothetical protein
MLEKAAHISKASHYRALLGRVYEVSGEKTKAHTILDELSSLSQRTYTSPFDIAVIFLGLGDNSSTFYWLEEAYNQRVFRLIELTMPMFDNLRTDARWQDMVCRIGLESELKRADPILGLK